VGVSKRCACSIAKRTRCSCSINASFPAWQSDKGVSEMILEYERVKRELEQMREMKAKYEELRQTHEKLQVENDEVRKIIGDMCAALAHSPPLHLHLRDPGTLPLPS